MKKLLTLILFSGMAVGASAQLVNNGGTITVQSGATLIVESDITNNGSGNITNNGIIEVKGDLTSVATATFTSDPVSTLKFSGTAPSTVNFMAATMLANVEMAKTAEDVTLASDLDIDGDLTFSEDDNQIILGANSLVLSSASAADNAAVTNSFIVTDGAGVVTKESLSAAFEFPVGAAIDSQNDITLTEAGTADNISVRVLADAYDTPATQTGAMTDDAVSATWEITEATTGGSDITAAPSWVAADETATFDNTDAAVYQYDGASYTALDLTGAATTANGISSISNAGLVLNGTDYVIVGDSGLGAFALLAAKVMLQGPYQASADLMRDQLRTKSLIPLTEPYTSMAAFTHNGGGGESVGALTDFDYAADNDDIVDWVFVEILDNTDAVIATRSALLQRDGDIVDIDGANSAVSFAGVTLGDYSVVVRHRNHLGVKSASTVSMDAGTTATYDFTTGDTQALGDQQFEVESGVWGIYAGNANGDSGSSVASNQIRMSGPPSINDYTQLLDVLGFNPSTLLTDVYNTEDLTMDGIVRMSGPPSINDYTRILEALSFSPSSLIIRAF